MSMFDLPQTLAEIVDYDPASLRVSSREGKHREFKQQFDRTDFSRYGKALAAFANTDGGILLFGITDAPRTIVGIDAAQFPDEAQWSDRLRRDFAPELPFSVREYAVNGLTVIALGIDRGSDPPVTCLRDNGVDRKAGGRVRHETLTNRGAIYHRQAGQTRPIHHDELRAMLERRDAARLNAFLQNVKIMTEVGPDKVGILDMSKGVAEGDATRLYLSRETARRLNFIERGRFVESVDEGDPAYVVLGNVHLNQMLAGPLDPEDQNLPAEAAEMLVPVIQEIFGEIPFTSHHLAKLAKFVGIRGGAAPDERFCIEDAKVKRVFYTRAGIQRLEQAIRDRPAAALHAFASRLTIEACERANG